MKPIEREFIKLVLKSNRVTPDQVAIFKDLKIDESTMNDIINLYSNYHYSTVTIGYNRIKILNINLLDSFSYTIHGEAAAEQLVLKKLIKNSLVKKTIYESH